MSRHSGVFQYWKPSRKLTWQQWEHLAWLIALALSVSVTAFAMITTIVLVSQDVSTR